MHLLSTLILTHLLYFLVGYILGDPGATNRDDAIFSGERYFPRESLLQELKGFLTKRVPEVVEIHPPD